MRENMKNIENINILMNESKKERTKHVGIKLRICVRYIVRLIC